MQNIHQARVISLDERNDHSVMPRPPRISVERTSKHTIYESLLHAAAERKDEIKQALLGLESKSAPGNSKNEHHPSIIVEEVNKTNYTDSIAEIIFNTTSKDKKIKKN